MNAVGSHFDNDGMLIVVNAKTLKKEIAFSNAELPGIDWPSHIAVIDEQHVYIRDNEGIKHLDMSSKELKFVEGTEQAPKSQFFTRDGKVYTYKPGLISGIIEITPEDDSVKKYFSHIPSRAKSTRYWVLSLPTTAIYGSCRSVPVRAPSANLIRQPAKLYNVK